MTIPTKTSTTKAPILDELQAIEERDGILKPEAVVEYAKNPETELHKHFTWDDSEAGQRYRVWQARKLIRVTVTMVNTGEKQIEAVAFVSLTIDRNHGGGYRSIANVLTDSELKARMLNDALKELQIFRKKYAELKELAAVFDAIDKLQ